MRNKQKERKTIEKILCVLAESDKWLILMHEKPDGDTAGCAAALALLGVRIGKKVTLGCPDPYPPKYLFLLRDIQFMVLDCVPTDFTGGGSVVICVDTTNPERGVKKISETRKNCPIINIDHHAGNTEYGSLNWIEPSASATGEMVTELMVSSEWGISQDEANALYVAIVTDNGNFSFPSSSKWSHECAVTLMEAGAAPGMIAEELETNLSVNMIRLWGRAFERTDLFSGGLCALYWLSLADFEETGATRSDTENLVNFLLKIRGVRIAALCSETEDGVRVNLRSRFPMDSREIAALFGGGGHTLAAGCTIREPIQCALSSLRREMERHAATRFSGTR
jgi:phosphoesterase RecJ-like protein